MYTIEYWRTELAAFDKLLAENVENSDQIDRLARGITFLGARTAQQNPAAKREIVDNVVTRLMVVEDQMGRVWFLSRIVEITTHALPS